MEKRCWSIYMIENKLVTDDNIKLVLQNAAKEDAVVELAPGGAVKVDAVVSATFRGMTARIRNSRFLTHSRDDARLVLVSAAGNAIRSRDGTITPSRVRT